MVAKTRKQRGGKSFHGPADGDNSTMGRIANYWYNTLGYQCWWSEGQDGYYFSLDRHSYMSQTHLHIFEITTLSNGKYVIRFAAKKHNQKAFKGGKIINLEQITDLMIELLNKITKTNNNNNN